jgi:hypothetical protein
MISWLFLYIARTEEIQICQNLLAIMSGSEVEASVFFKDNNN